MYFKDKININEKKLSFKDCGVYCTSGQTRVCVLLIENLLVNFIL